MVRARDPRERCSRCRRHARYVDIAIEEADRIQATMEDPLAYSRVEAADDDVEAVDCEAVLRRVREDHGGNSSRPTPTSRWADADRLGRPSTVG